MEIKMVIVTDTGSDILESEAKQMQVELVPICSNFEDITFSRNTEENFKAFYQKLRETEVLPFSSQPSPSAFLEIYERAREQGREVLVITISSELSGTYNGALLAKEISGYEKIEVVDSRQASLSERLLVEYAVKLRDEGKDREQLRSCLEEAKERILLTGVPESLTYLKKGGRISPVIAAVGGIMGIKPVLRLKDGVIECCAKARGMKMARSSMRSFLEQNEVDPCMPVLFAHSDNEQMGREFMEETADKCELSGCVLHDVGMAIGTHLGPGAILMSFLAKNKI